MRTTKFLGVKVEAKSTYIGCIAILLIMLVSAFIGGFCIKYSVNNWLEWAGKPQSFTYWHGFLIGLIPYLGFGSIMVAIITFVLTFFF